MYYASFKVAHFLIQSLVWIAYVIIKQEVKIVLEGKVRVFKWKKWHKDEDKEKEKDEEVQES